MVALYSELVRGILDLSSTALTLACLASDIKIWISDQLDPYLNPQVGPKCPQKSPATFCLLARPLQSAALGLTTSLARLICTAQARPEGLPAFDMSSPTH